MLGRQASLCQAFDGVGDNRAGSQKEKTGSGNWALPWPLAFLNWLCLYQSFLVRGSGKQHVAEAK